MTRKGQPLRAEAPSKPFRFRVSPAERDIIKRAAALNRQAESTFARDAVLTAASECLEDVKPPARSGRQTILTPRGVGH